MGRGDGLGSLKCCLVGLIEGTTGDEWNRCIPGRIATGLSVCLLSELVDEGAPELGGALELRETLELGVVASDARAALTDLEFDIAALRYSLSFVVDPDGLPRGAELGRLLG